MSKVSKVMGCRITNAVPTRCKSGATENNTAVGNFALFTQSYSNGGARWSSFNVAVGDSVLYYNQSTTPSGYGQRNSGIGFCSLKSNVLGSGNTAAGAFTLYNNNSGTENSAIGENALYSNISGKRNTSTGEGSLFSNTTADYNTANGWSALSLNTTGVGNTAMGYEALYHNTTGGEGTINQFPIYANTAIGYLSLFYNTSAYNNTASGSHSLYNNTTGIDNSGDGVLSLYSNTQGHDNIAVGENALSLNTIGHNNTVVGVDAGQSNTIENYNTCIGSGANTIAGYNNCMALGYGTVSATASDNTIEIGNSSVIYFHGNAPYQSSDRRIKKNINANVPGLSFINLLKPVTFYKDIHIENSIKGYPTKTTIIPEVLDTAGNVITPASTVTTIDTAFWPSKYDVEHILYTGLIAQQVDSAAMQRGYDFSGIHRPQGPHDLYALSYSQFVVPLIKGEQELSKSNDSLKKCIKTLDSLIILQRIKYSLLNVTVNNLMATVANCCAHGQTQRGTQNNNNQHQNINEDTIRIDITNNDQIILYQNEPNPFDNNTVIRYFIPIANTSEAFIIFNDIYGKEIMKVEITVKGFGNIKANTENLASGIYTYSLYVANNLIDTKKMLRNK